nr:MAG TPA: hypothetical protein [Caudoviricetes sp.]
MATLDPMRPYIYNYYKLLIYIGFLVFSPFIFFDRIQTFLIYRRPVMPAILNERGSARSRW